MKKIKIVVDLFNQHGGDLVQLKKNAMSAWLAGADVVKFQILNSKKIWGDDSRAYLEMTDAQIVDFFNFCKNNSIPCTATAFDERGLYLIKRYMTTDFFKIASFTLKHDKLLAQQIAETANQRNCVAYASSGLLVDDDDLVWFRELCKTNNVNALFCISKYPTLLTDPEMIYFPRVFDGCTYYGFSDHTVGISAAILAVTRGAKFIEKHFTNNRSLQNNTEKAHLCSFTEQSLKTFRTIVDELALITQQT